MKRIGRTSLLVSFLLLGLVSAPAEAAMRVYVDLPGIPRALPIGTTTFPIFVVNGTSATTSGVACVHGNGDELCGWSVGLEATGGITLDAFVPDEPTTISNLQSDLLRLNGVAATSGRLGPIRIGSLQVTVASPGQIQGIPGGVGTGVSANLELLPVPAGVVALPEPGLGLSLAAAALATRTLDRRRRLDRDRRRSSDLPE